MPETPMWRRYLRLLGPNVGEDLDEELRFHLETLTEELMEKGMDPDRARAEAERRVGDVRRVREEVKTIERGGARRERLANLRQDVGYAARVLWRSPGFTLVAVLTLALGIGANTAIFSVVNSVLLRPLPVEGLDRLVVVREDLPDLDLLDAPLAPAAVMDLRALDGVFEGFTGTAEGERTLTGRGDPSQLAVVRTLGDFGSVFQVRPRLGRFYGPESSTDGQHRIAVVSHGLWQQLSGGSPSFIGETLVLNGEPHEVVGVMAPEFDYPRRTQVWVPFEYGEHWAAPNQRGRLIMTAVGRLRPGVTPEQLAARLDAEVGRWNAASSRSGTGEVLRTTNFVEYLAGPLRLILLVLMGAVVFVLMIAAANVASLQMVRAAGRSREIAVRSAVGAGRGRIVGQLLVESLMLSVLGGALGLTIGAGALALLRRWEPAREMSLAPSLDGSVLAFTAAVALLASVLFGTVPALRGSRVSPQDVLRESSRGASAGLGKSRLLRASVVAQVALALILLLASGLMIRTLSRLLAADPGFAPENLTTARVSLSGERYNGSSQQLDLFFGELLERVRALPGVTDAAIVVGLPFAGSNDSSPFEIAGRPKAPGDPDRHHEASIVTEGYFRTMGIPIIRGRDFEPSDRTGAPGAVLIDQTFAEQFFPGADPVGEQIRGYTGDLTTIIGVVGRVDHDEVGDAPKATAYYSVRQLPWYASRSIVVRSALPEESVVRLLRNAAAELDPNVPLHDVRTMRGRIEQSLGPQRLAMLALGAFSGLSLLLATLGVYGVMRYTTNQRTREIGIRMALGARPRDVVRLVVRQGMAITLLGLALGVLAALGLTRFMAGVLFGVSPHDPVSFVAATAVLAGVALAASWVPARRATRVDPVEALRSE